MEWKTISSEEDFSKCKLTNHVGAFYDMIINICSQINQVFLTNPGDSAYVVEIVGKNPDIIASLMVPDQVPVCFSQENAACMIKKFIHDHPDFCAVALEQQKGEFKYVLINNKPASFTNFKKMIEKSIKKKEEASFSVSIQSDEPKIIEIEN